MAAEFGTYDPGVVRIGTIGVRIIRFDDAVRGFIEYCVSDERRRAERPLYATSVNGHVISTAFRDPRVMDAISRADIVDCDGQPLVLLSRLFCRSPLIERVATTDMFPALAAEANERGLSFYLLGATEDVNRRAADWVRRTYPGIRLVGARHGYFDARAEKRIVDEIVHAAPDILWVSMGVPKEQDFCVRNLRSLRGVGVVKTSGGLLDFLSGSRPRAPRWMQNAGLEWAFRTCLEPRRLFWRYFVTNQHAMFLMLTRLR